MPDKLEHELISLKRKIATLATVMASLMLVASTPVRGG
jgi:hypothetical protein